MENMEASSQGNQENDPLQDVECLKKELEEAKQQVEQYKFASKSFERRVVDLQIEMSLKDEELKSLKEQNEKSLSARCPPSEIDEGEEPIVLRKLFVGGLSQAVTDENLFEYFSKYGEVAEAVVMKDLHTNKSRGFGFVVFSQSSMADVAQVGRPHRILGKEVDTKRAIPKSTIELNSIAPKSMIQSRRVFVGGLKSTTTNDILKNYFQIFGKVESVSVMEDSKTKRSRGFAYVTFDDSDAADRVILQKFHLIDSRRCEVKPAYSKLFKSPNEDSFNKPLMDGCMRDQPYAGENAYGGQHQQYENHGSYDYSSYMPGHQLNTAAAAAAAAAATKTNPIDPANASGNEAATTQYNSNNNTDTQMWGGWNAEAAASYSRGFYGVEGQAQSTIQNSANSAVRPIRNQGTYFPRAGKPY